MKEEEIIKKVKKKFKQNHETDGFGNPYYDSIIEELVKQTYKLMVVKK